MYINELREITMRKWVTLKGNNLINTSKINMQYTIILLVFVYGVTCISTLTHNNRFSNICLSVCQSATLTCWPASADSSYVPWNTLVKERNIQPD